MTRSKLISGFWYGIILFILFLLGFIALYPFIYTLSMSVSSPMAIMRNQIYLIPVGFSLKSYQMIFNDQSIWRSYYNTIWYTVVGTGINLVTTITAGWVLSRKQFFATSFFMVMITIPMFFSGGMIANFVLVGMLGLYNTRWAIVLPAAMSSWNIIITRSFFKSSIPDSIPEAAKIDGANDLQTFLKVILPVSKAIIAIITLYSAVGFWNSYFSALIYLPNTLLHPMTIMLRKLIIQGTGDNLAILMGEGSDEALMYAMQIRYTTIIVSILPIICVYPFLQKYFVKGVMIGSIKE